VIKRHRKYYYSDDSVGLKEIRWFRTQLMIMIVAGTFLALACVLCAGYFLGNLGNERKQIAALRLDNQVLQDQITQMMGQVSVLDKTITELNDEGNHLRLLVDLPPIDEATRRAGIGGAISGPNIPVASDNITELINSASSTIGKLGGEIEVQKQNYEEISKKQEYDKGLFAAMPALKPMEGYYSPTSFGMRMHPVLGIVKRHEGLDIINDVGTPVYVSADGTVEFAGQSGGGYGIMIMVDHGYGYETLYAHLSQVLVKEGQHLKRGDLIAKSGRTGLVTGPHLHYEVRYKGVFQNPVDYFLDDVRPSDLKAGVASE
jgi:murein DD-endopeptidase MepM/ murein hydrolase activator NlpD